MEAVWVSMETNWVNAMRISSNSPDKNFWQTRREISKQSLTEMSPATANEVVKIEALWRSKYSTAFLPMGNTQ